ncbi:MAG TPA: peptidylprolyl isomerase [Verrucomicrobiae bacterium]|nr:peptidylprolyl isomerase [Verrucomicrobiae bacterium]
MTRFILLTLILICSILRGAAAEIDDYISAIVNDSVVTFHDVRDASRNSLGALEQLYIRQPDLLQQKAASVMNEAREALVAKALIVDEFKNSIGVVPENMLDNQISQQIRREFMDRENFRKSLRQKGMSMEKYRKMVHDDMVVRFMVDRNVRSAIIISPQKIESYYTNHLEEYKVGNEVKLRMIVLRETSAPTMAAVKKLGQEIVTKLNAGESFGEMAAIYSEGSQKKQQGDWGWIDPDKMRRGLADVAFSLKAGERSPLIGLAYGQGEQYAVYRYDKQGQLTKALKYSEKQGQKDQLIEEKDFTNDSAGAAALPEPQEYYLMLVEDKRIARTKSLAEMKEEIEKNLIIEERQRLHKQWIERLEAKAYVRRF